MQPLLLASSSLYRRQLLAKFGLVFQWAAPDIDESVKTNESPNQLVMRLAETKARTLSNQFPEHLIIGSDQVAVINDRIIGKPGTHAKAVQQLKDASGKTVTFKTGLCLFNASTNRTHIAIEETRVYFRPLTDYQIEHYLQQEKPYDCAGSFKTEGLGICLFNKIEGNDVNALIGLPLIRLSDMLREEGIDPLLHADLLTTNSVGAS